MTYEIVVSPRAQKEIENAIDYYALYSKDAPRIFISKVSDAYHVLQTKPFFKVQYKNIRALKINKFPYCLYFIIDEEKARIRILTCFHTKRNPKRRP